MKRYIIYIMAVVATLFTGCVNDLKETPEMKDVGQIEVSVNIEGESVRTLHLSSASHTVVVDVTLNNEGLYWQPIADKEWCRIVEEEHRGSGSFTLNIDRNDSFDSREAANIKFVAGEYEKDILAVNHSGNVFIVDMLYTTASKFEGSMTINVKTKKDLEWEIAEGDWLSATKGNTSDSGDFVTTEVNVKWSENDGVSRFGKLNFVVTETNITESRFALWQYGTEYNYDDEGYLLLSAKEVEPLELRVPSNVVKRLVLPNWVSATEPTENYDGTLSYLLSFSDNPSDAMYIRPSKILIEVLGAESETIQLPEIRQEFYPIGGLLTGAGLQLFAKTWNEGGDISPWYIDGVPTIVGDVDMSLVEDWTPIGTAERPFSGKFEGGANKIQYFKSSSPLFGYCEDAEICNVVFDETCEIAQKSDYNSKLNLAPLALEVAEMSVISNCESYASILVEGSSTVADYTANIGGLICKVHEGSKVTGCKFYGNIDVKENNSVYITATDNSRSYVGAIASQNGGTIEKCLSEGTISFNAYSRYLQMGGIVAYAEDSSLIDSNHNISTINYSSLRKVNGINDISRYGYIGGIVAFAGGTISNNESEGDIFSTSNIKLLYMGGIAAVVNKEGVIFRHNSVANRADLSSKGAVRYAYMGGLIGYGNKNIAIDFTDDSGVISGYIYVKGIEKSAGNTTVAAGGIVGQYDASDDSSILLSLTNPKWEGKMVIDLENTDVEAKEICGGGIVGNSTGKINIGGATSNGDNITVKVTSEANTMKSQFAIGGVVGLCTREITISNATNNTPISWNTFPKKSNGNPSWVGGILGCVKDAAVTIANCHNKGEIYNGHYNNNAYSTSVAGVRTSMCATGGIVGSAGVGSGSTSKVTITGCSNIAKIDAHRAAVGGIAGYIVNATCSDCSFTNGSIGKHANPYGGGIAGVAELSNIDDCSVITNIESTTAGSCGARTGGIVAMTVGENNITNCAYSGTLTIGVPATSRFAEGEFAGCIVGYSSSECSISGCKWGGHINNSFFPETDTSSGVVEVNSSNFEGYAVGVNAAGDSCPIREITNCSYWDGSLE